MPTGAIFGDTGRNNDLDQIGEFGLFMRVFGTRRYSMEMADSISGSVSPGSNPGPAAPEKPLFAGLSLFLRLLRPDWSRLFPTDKSGR